MSQVPVGWVKGKINGPLLGDWSSFCQSLCLSFSAVYFPSRGRARWVGRRRWALSRRRQSSKSASCYFPFIFREKSILLFFRVWFCFFLHCWICLQIIGSPPPCYHDAYSVGAPNLAFRGKGWLSCCKTTFSSLFGRFFLLCERTIYFFWWRF